MNMNSSVSDFVRAKVCFYSSMFRGRSSAWEISRYAADHGAHGVELMNFCDELRTPDMKAAKEIGAFIRSEGMMIPCFSAGTNLVGECGRENLEKLKSYAEICAELEIPYLHHTIASGLDPSKYASNTEAAFNEGAEAALRINEYAAHLGVGTIVEDQGFVFNGVESYKKFMDIADGKIGTLLDVGNIMFVDERAEDFLAAFSKNTVHVHIKDYKLFEEKPEDRKTYKTRKGNYISDCEIGTGVVNFVKIAEELAHIPYKGCYSMEFAATDGEEEVLRVLDRMCGWFA